MGVPVLILGRPSAGKSYSMKNLPPDEVGIFEVRKDHLPFKGEKRFKFAKHATYPMIYSVLKNAKKKIYIIDDSQYLMANEYFATVNEKGYDKYTRMGCNFNDLLKLISETTPEDCIVYLMHHTEIGDDGIQKAKTVGKMLDNYLTIEGCVDICLYAVSDSEGHAFITNNDGTSPAKSPEGMFEAKRIPNDLKVVDKAIRDYYFSEEETTNE